MPQDSGHRRMAALDGGAALADALRPRIHQPHEVSGYRVFAWTLLICIVLIVRWSDRNLAEPEATLVGVGSVIVCGLTALGSFGVGPMAALWRALRRVGRSLTAR